MTRSGAIVGFVVSRKGPQDFIKDFSYQSEIKIHQDKLRSLLNQMYGFSVVGRISA